MRFDATLHDGHQHVHLLDEEPAGIRSPTVRQVFCRRRGLSAITYAELEFGVRTSADPDRERANLAALIEDIPVADFGVQAGMAYGPIRMATRESKKDHLDKLIAAHAVSLKVTLVTNNERDFDKYPGVMTENWLEPVGKP